jgi:hypothetical protein
MASLFWYIATAWNDLVYEDGEAIGSNPRLEIRTAVQLGTLLF